MFLQSLETKEMEMQTYLIARDHLGTSFDLRRTNAFQAFLQSQNQKKSD